MKKLFTFLTLMFFLQPFISQAFPGGSSTWVLQDTVELPYTTLSGAASDGAHLYLTSWDGPQFIKTSMQGTVLEEFTISGVSQIRDLCYDGQYFYGGRADSVIYQMDLAGKQLSGEIHAPSEVEVRFIAYDSAQDAFWVGNWSSPFFLINRNGSILDTIPYHIHQRQGVSGLAIDRWNHHSPQFWFSSSTPNAPVMLGHMFPQGNSSGLYKELSHLAPLTTDPRARGVSTFIYQGQPYLTGIIQGDPSTIYIYQLTSMIKSNDVAAKDITSPLSSCNLGSSETPVIKVANLGLDTVWSVPITIQLKQPVHFTLTDTITQPIPPMSSILHSVNQSFYMGSPHSYDFLIYTDLPQDEYRANDTLRKSIIHLEPANLPFTALLDTANEIISGWSVLDANNDGYTWEFEPKAGSGNTGAFIYSWNPNATTPGNDWLFSPCITLDTGNLYALKYTLRAGLDGYEEMVSVYLGEKQEIPYMTQKINYSGKIDSADDVVVTDHFSVNNSGVYYLGFHVHSDPNKYKLYLDNVIIDGSVGVSPASELPSLRLFPNPAKDKLHIRSSHTVEAITIYDLSGRVLLNKPSVRENSFTVNIDDLPAGMYFITFAYDSHKETRKLIKE